MLRCVLIAAVVLSMQLCLLAQVVETDSGLKFVMPFAPLLESLKKANVSGSLEFSGACSLGTLEDWPHWRISPAGNKPLQVAQETFADDPPIRVTQDADGTIRMIQNGVPTDLLNAKISHLPRSYANNARGLVEAIMWAPEVTAFRSAHHIHIPVPSGWPAEGGPGRIPPEFHVFGAMNDVTVSHDGPYS
jgi:hypothetical protein